MKLTTLQHKVIEQLGYTAEDVGENEELMGILSNVTEHGADAGWTGFTYYSDTIDFALDNLPPILDHLRELADGCYDSGTTLAQVIAGFRCMQGYTAAEIEGVLIRPKWENDSQTTVLNALAWYALEETARELTNN